MLCGVAGCQARESSRGGGAHILEELGAGSPSIAEPTGRTHVGLIEALVEDRRTQPEDTCPGSGSPRLLTGPANVPSKRAASR